MAYQISQPNNQRPEEVLALPEPNRGHQGIHIKEVSHESQTVCEAHVREVQDHQAQGQSHGHLREPQAQAETGLTLKLEVLKEYGTYCRY